MSQKIKCIVWDLDHTLWNGILSEDDSVVLRENIVDFIRELDGRGILHSISSKNDYDSTKKKLEEFGLWDYFLYPQISWSSKSSAISRIKESLNIGYDAIAFIDDQEFELEEVAYTHPQVLCINVEKIGTILDDKRFIPTFITEDSRNRRRQYQDDYLRKEMEEQFQGPQVDFLKTLSMELFIKQADIQDLRRVEELTVRTNQLNSTGITYSYQELADYLSSDSHQLFICELTDKLGSYGKVGVLLLEMGQTDMTIKLLISSCRVMSRGIGGVMLNFAVRKSMDENKKLFADFVHTDKNKMMYITYKMAGFVEAETSDSRIRFSFPSGVYPNYPSYMTVHDSVQSKVECG